MALAEGTAIRRLKRVEYDQLVATGMFERERVELLDGMLLRKAPHGPEHDGTIEILRRMLAATLGERASIRIQSAFAATEDAEPEPDIAVVPRRDYRDAHPSEAHLIVEVAVSSAAYDRNKAATYARARVPEYWNVDLSRGVVEVHRAPSAEGYEQRTTHRAGETIGVLAFPDVAVALADVLRR